MCATTRNQPLCSVSTVIDVHVGDITDEHVGEAFRADRVLFTLEEFQGAVCSDMDDDVWFSDLAQPCVETGVLRVWGTSGVVGVSGSHLD